MEQPSSPSLLPLPLSHRCGTSVSPPSLFHTSLSVPQAAEYFEAHGQADRAVSLYQKAGQTARAVELCFRLKLFDQLREIAEALPSDADPVLINRCAE